MVNTYLHWKIISYLVKYIDVIISLKRALADQILVIVYVKISLLWFFFLFIDIIDIFFVA